MEKQSSSLQEIEEKKAAVLALLPEKKYVQIGRLMKELEAVDVVALFEELPREDTAKLYRLLPKEQAAEVFACMDGDEKELLIERLSDRELQEVLDEMYLDDTVDMIEEMPAGVVKRILKNTRPSARREINELLKYPKDSAGSIMTPEYVELKKHMTVAQAFERIRNTGVDKETIYTCYVTENDKKLAGIISARTLFLAEQEETVESLMDTSYIFAYTMEDKEETAKKFDKYDLLAIPVVDKEGRLVGIVTFDDAMDVMQDEAEEDFEIMAAVTPGENSYFKMSAFTHARNRVIWLLVLMISATLTGIIIANYEQAFAAVPLLVSFIPMLMGTGGNCGSQSSTMVIRGMAVDEIRLKDFFRVIWKEFRIALLVSLVLSVINGIRIYIMYGDALLSAVIALSLVVTIILAELLGCGLPMLAKWLKIDPAIMAAPLITTLVDACSVLVYFNIALRLLPITV